MHSKYIQQSLSYKCIYIMAVLEGHLISVAFNKLIWPVILWMVSPIVYMHYILVNVLMSLIWLTTLAKLCKIECATFWPKNILVETWIVPKSECPCMVTFCHSNRTILGNCCGSLPLYMKYLYSYFLELGLWIMHSFNDFLINKMNEESLKQ